MTPARQSHPQRCGTCKKRETLQCPIQDEDIYYEIKQQVTVPTGWEILTSCIGCASHSTYTSAPAPTTNADPMDNDPWCPWQHTSCEEAENGDNTHCNWPCFRWFIWHDAQVAKAERGRFRKMILDMREDGTITSKTWALLFEGIGKLAKESLRAQPEPQQEGR